MATHTEKVSHCFTLSTGFLLYSFWLPVIPCQKKNVFLSVFETVLILLWSGLQFVKVWGWTLIQIVTSFEIWNRALLGINAARLLFKASYKNKGFLEAEDPYTTGNL